MRSRDRSRGHDITLSDKIKIYSINFIANIK